MKIGSLLRRIPLKSRLASIAATRPHSAAGTAPIRIIEFAIEEFGKARAYERVYAVFDRDDHASYANAIHKADATNLRNDENKTVTFEAAVSVPCFELWFLLHFVEIRAYDHRDVISNRLRGFVPDYGKGRRGMYALTKANLQQAIQRAA
jgi:hypothetical protein